LDTTGHKRKEKARTWRAQWVLLDAVGIKNGGETGIRTLGRV
jgi:hypothetical protein